MTKKETQIYNLYIERGLSADIAEILIEANRVVNIESVYREYRKRNEDKGDETHFKKLYSPNEKISGAHEIAHRLKMETECNHQLF